ASRLVSDMLMGRRIQHAGAGLAVLSLLTFVSCFHGTVSVDVDGPALPSRQATARLEQDVDADAGPDVVLDCRHPAVTLHGNTRAVGAGFTWAAADGRILSNEADLAVADAGIFILIVADSSGEYEAADTVVVSVAGDTTAPTLYCPDTLVVPCGGSIGPDALGFATAADACDDDPMVSFRDSATVADCVSESRIRREWIATDASGNTAVRVQTILVIDDRAPVFTYCPPDFAVSCDDTVPPPPPVRATDACGTVEIVFTEHRDVDSCGGYTGVVVRAWIASDLCGNADTCRQVVTIADWEPPVISGVQPDTMLSCPDVPVFETPVATDNCDASPSLEFADTRQEGVCAQEYQVTRTWTAIDACGNVATRSRTISVLDTLGPVLTMVPESLTVSCPAEVPPPNTTLLAATDVCTDTVRILHHADRIRDSVCDGDFVIARIYHALDECGNYTTAEQIITVRDTVAPSITRLPEPIRLECASDPLLEPDTSVFAAEDNCSAPLRKEFVADRYSDTICPDGYTITRTYRARDACGNAVACEQVITVRDETPPVLQCALHDTVTGVDLIPLPDPADVVVTDNCGGSVEVEHLGDGPLTGGPVGGTVVRRYRGSDLCGNMTVATQVIPVRTGRLRVAVLPFANYTGEPEALDAFGSGVADELQRLGIVELVPGVRDVLRRYRIRAVGAIDAAGIAALSRELQIGYLLTGSIDTYNRGRIPEIGFSLRLIDAEKQEVVWAGSAGATGLDFSGILGMGQVTSLAILLDRLLTEALAQLDAAIRTGLPRGTARGGRLAVVTFDDLDPESRGGRIATGHAISQALGAGFVVVEPGVTTGLCYRYGRGPRGEIDFELLSAVADSLDVTTVLTGVVERFTVSRPSAERSFPEIVLRGRLLDAVGGRIRATADVTRGGDRVTVFGLGGTRSSADLTASAMQELLRRLNDSEEYRVDRN
ncbi:MAG TPA: hypothetical protein VLB27_10870, partial [candidate division Zixibacteria bacterium]|nr:hypothetical protein [candidate division Zixibacteria bacterium]